MTMLNAHTPLGVHYTALATDRAMEVWYDPSIARMTPNRRVTWQATSDAENASSTIKPPFGSRANAVGILASSTTTQ
jgi:hypothetical protein